MAPPATTVRRSGRSAGRRTSSAASAGRGLAPPRPPARPPPLPRPRSRIARSLGLVGRCRERREVVVGRVEHRGVRFGLVEVVADHPDGAAGEVAGEAADGLPGEDRRGVPRRRHRRRRDGIDDDSGAVQELLADHAATVRAGRGVDEVDSRNVASSTWANTVTDSRRASTGAAACRGRHESGHAQRPTSRTGEHDGVPATGGDRPQRGRHARWRRQQRLGHRREHDGQGAVVGVGGDAAARLVHVGADREPQPVDEPAEEPFGRHAEGVQPPQHGAQQLRGIGLADHVAVEPGHRLEVALAAAWDRSVPAGPT